ncbi:hypothetical protein [Streptomyces sp. NPDC006739]|uniref:hypothetical protein n=1 Tax=Streptomyces sp. NPDC006739 TaxID=3364763 RepID=UPI0036907BBB
MKKITALAALTLAALALGTPAHAEDNGGLGGTGTRTGTTSHRNSLSDNVCKEALAVVPFALPWTGDAMTEACNNQEHLDNASD